MNSCNRICLLTPLTSINNYTACECPQDMEMSADNKTCIMKHKINAIYAAAGNTIVQLKYDKIGKRQFEEYPLNGITVLGDMTYNAIAGTATYLHFE